MKLDVKSPNPFLEFVKSAVVEVNLLAAIPLIVYHLHQCAIKDKKSDWSKIKVFKSGNVLLSGPQ